MHVTPERRREVRPGESPANTGENQVKNRWSATYPRAMSTDQPVDVKPRSREVTDGIQRAGARAMLRAVGMTDDDWDKPQIGIANSWNEVTPCNMTLRTLAEHVKAGRARRRGASRWSSARSPCRDGISMGHEGMRASLVSREISCDSVEAVVHAERLDGFVGMAGCDKSMPAMLMAAGPSRPGERARLQRLDPARRAQRPVARHHERVRGRRRLRRRQDHRGASSARSSAAPARVRARAAGCSPPTR